jgi:hypothetical protein
VSQFSNQLQASIEAAALTQKCRLPKRRECPKDALSRYVRRENRPPPDVLEKLLKAFPDKQRTSLGLAYLADDLTPTLRDLIQHRSKSRHCSRSGGRRRLSLPDAERSCARRTNGIGFAALEDADVASQMISNWRILQSRKK